jgi:hypothetical protein
MFKNRTKKTDNVKVIMINSKLDQVRPAFCGLTFKKHFSFCVSFFGPVFANRRFEIKF